MTEEYIRWERDKIHHTYDDMLARIRTRCRIKWEDYKWFVIGAKGESWGAYFEKDMAKTMYMLCCSLADLPPSEHLYVPGHTGGGWP